MRRMVQCPHCGHLINTALPSVTPEEAAELKANDDDRRTTIKCPQCERAIHLLHWDLPFLPLPPP
jgi:endogenous inhibitor of DNA gyrase (YacG/DUF329 family)